MKGSGCIHEMSCQFLSRMHTSGMTNVSFISLYEFGWEVDRLLCFPNSFLCDPVVPLLGVRLIELFGDRLVWMFVIVHGNFFLQLRNSWHCFLFCVVQFVVVGVVDLNGGGFWLICCFCFLFFERCVSFSDRVVVMATNCDLAPQKQNTDCGMLLACVDDE